MQKILPLLLGLISTSLFANFDFNSCSGSGTFEQKIVYYSANFENAATVGKIPKGIQGLKIYLISNKDVDIRLYADNGDKIVHWPRGILNGASLATKPYNHVNVTYSGYDGIGGEKGHEFIQIDGTTPTSFTMKAFGYELGYATVNYSWTGKDGCTPVPSGTGTFEQTILNKATNLVGTIPPNVENVEIKLTSTNDLDIQLYAQDGTAIARWKPAGLMSGDEKQSVMYHDMSITWSGYNGVNDQRGHEYITIEGNTTEMFVMKVYGYHAGTAHVFYKWGNIKDGINNKYKLLKTGQTIDYEAFDDGYYQKGKERSYSRNDAKEIVTDNVTGLQWQDNYDVGTVTKPWLTQAKYDAENYSDTSGDTATTYCAKLTLGGYTNWRLPTSKELENIVDYSIVSPSIDRTYFQNLRATSYWSSRPNAVYEQYAWYVNFYSGYVGYGYKSEYGHILCVRNGK